MKRFSWLGLVALCVSLSACGNSNLGESSPELEASATTIKSVYFGAPTGAYTPERLRADWGNLPWEDGVSEGYASIVPNGQYYKLQIKHPKNSFSSGTKWNYPFPGRNVATVDYKLRFKEDFDFVRGGKLPGLCGGPCDTGANRTDNGWSSRVMWYKDGRAVSYVYRGNRADPSYPYGENFQWKWQGSGYDVFFERGRTYDIKQTVTMNTPGRADGKLEVWLDGSKVLDRDDIRWAKSGSSTIDKLAMHTFFGGGDSSWAPKKDEYLWLDNFIISD